MLNHAPPGARGAVSQGLEGSSRGGGPDSSRCKGGGEEKGAEEVGQADGKTLLA